MSVEKSKGRTKMRQVFIWSSIALLTGSILTLAGSLLSFDFLTRWNSTSSPMSPVASTLFILSGLACISYQISLKYKLFKTVCYTIASAILLVCSVKVGSMAFGRPHLVSELLGIDVRKYGVLSLPTTLGLGFASTGLVLTHKKLPFREGVGTILGLLCALIGLFRCFAPGLGFLEGIAHADLEGMSLPSGVLLLFLGTMLIFLQPNAGLPRALTRKDLPGQVGRKTLVNMLGGGLITVSAYVVGRYWLHILDPDSGLTLVIVCLVGSIVAGIWLQIEYHAESVERAELLFDSPKHLTASLELNGRINQVSSTWTQATQWQEADLLGRRFIEFIHPDDVERTKQVIEHVAIGDASTELANRFVCQDGSYRWLEWSAKTTGHEELIYVIGRDVTEEKVIQSQAELERNVVISILDWAEDVIVVINDKGTIVRASKSSEKAFGYPPGELVGKNVSMLMGDPHHGLHDSYLKRYAATRERRVIGINRELAGKRQDGTEFPLVLSVGEMSTPDGPLYFGVMRDITKEKQDIAELNLAKDEAERANMAKSEFLSRMSHELRTPLNSVLGFAQLLELNYSDPKILKMVSSIQRGGRHLLELINEILDISRIESGKLALSLEPIHLGSVLMQAMELVKPLALSGQVSLEAHWENASTTYVLGDRQRLLQIFINLLSNGIKYNRPEGFLRVHVSEVKDKVVLRFEDSGCGISEEHQADLFVPFERLGAEYVEGTGLGLALSQKLSELMEASLELSSSGDTGSTFTVSLKKADAPAIPESTLEKTISVETGSVSREATILYVEDNLSNIELMEHLVAGWEGVNLMPAMQGRLGLELAVRHLPDVILLDVHLPDLGGAEVLRQLLADDQTKNIPVIVVSADATDSQRRNMISIGAREYLTKPLDVETLCSTISQIFTELGVSNNLECSL